MQDAIDPYILKHLAQFMITHIREDHHEAFSNFALSRIVDDPDYWLRQEWAKLYGQFLMADMPNPR